jgi:hypothetical protein
MQAENSSQDLDISVRVGCSLSYEVTGSASLLLNLQLASDARHSVLFEALALGNGLVPEGFDDSHGNRVCRVTLQPGTNCFRHDTIVARSSKPDNYGLVPGTPEDVRNLPLVLLRYRFPAAIATPISSPIPTPIRA